MKVKVPISKEDFEHGLDDNVKKLMAFLSENKGKAFTLEELSAKTGFDNNITKRILGYVAEKKYIKSKDIGAYRYYIFQKMP